MPQSYVKFHYCCIQILCKHANEMRKRLHARYGIEGNKKKRPLASSEQPLTI